MTDDPTLDVAADLRQIIELTGALLGQAVAKATHHDMPGGDAMVMLGPAARPADWERRAELIEAEWFATDQTTARPAVGADEDPTWEPPLQTLRFWTQDHHETDNPTTATEARWLIDNLRWIHDHEPHWDNFVKDVAAARRRLEAVLYAGERDERAKVPCIDCDLDRDGAPLRVMLVIHYAGPSPGWVCPACKRRGADDHWVCTRCQRQYDEPALRRAEYHDLIRRGLDRHVRIDTAARALDVPRGRLTRYVTACEWNTRAQLCWWPDVRHLRRETTAV